MGVVAFVSTNADNLLVLASLRSAGSVSRRSLSLGYLLGLAGVLLLVLMVAGLSRLIPVHLVGFLGVVPIAFGIRQLAAPDAGEAEAPLANGTRGEVALVASFQIASSGDIIAVAAPLLAESAVVPPLHDRRRRLRPRQHPPRLNQGDVPAETTQLPNPPSPRPNPHRGTFLPNRRGHRAVRQERPRWRVAVGGRGVAGLGTFGRNVPVVQPPGASWRVRAAVMASR